MKSFTQYIQEQDMTGDSGKQFEPDKPQDIQIQDLVNAFKEIIDLAKSALMKSKSLTNELPTLGDKPERIARPLADGPDSLFGM